VTSLKKEGTVHEVRVKRITNYKSSKNRVGMGFLFKVVRISNMSAHTGIARASTKSRNNAGNGLLGRGKQGGKIYWEERVEKLGISLFGQMNSREKHNGGNEKDR